jgi:hypothetical protein
MAQFQLMLRVSVGMLVVTSLVSVAGCGGPSAEEMREAAESLVPPGSRIVGRRDRDCVQLADSPSCHELTFVGPVGTLEERADAIRTAAQEAGWEREEELRTEGATFLDYSRDGMEASVSLWADFRAEPCRARPNEDCADRVRVIR